MVKDYNLSIPKKKYNKKVYPDYWTAKRGKTGKTVVSPGFRVIEFARTVVC